MIVVFQSQFFKYFFCRNITLKNVTSSQVWALSRQVSNWDTAVDVVRYRFSVFDFIWKGNSLYIFHEDIRSFYRLFVFFSLIKKKLSLCYRLVFETLNLNISKRCLRESQTLKICQKFHFCPRVIKLWENTLHYVYKQNM